MRHPRSCNTAARGRRVAAPGNMTKPGYSMQTMDLGECVCGQRIYASRTGIAGVVHEAPACQKFLELEPVEFLKYVRRSRGIPDGAAEYVQ